jgi:hypothetical protein
MVQVMELGMAWAMEMLGESLDLGLLVMELLRALEVMQE